MRRMVWRAVCLALLAAGGAPLEAQSVRSLVNDGNDLYDDRKYTDAEESYRKALQEQSSLVPGHFNLGASLYRQGKFDEARTSFEAAAALDNEDLAPRALYNMGNSLVKAGQYAEAVKAYAGALRANPKDLDAKYNLSYALRMMRQQQQQQQKQDQQQDKKDNQNQQDQQNQQNQQDKQDQQQQQNRQQDQQKNDGRQDRAGNQEKQMSRQDAERILEVLRNNERDVQKKVRVRAAQRTTTERDW